MLQMHLCTLGLTLHPVHLVTCDIPNVRISQRNKSTLVNRSHPLLLIIVPFLYLQSKSRFVLNDEGCIVSSVAFWTTAYRIAILCLFPSSPLITATISLSAPSSVHLITALQFGLCRTIIHTFTHSLLNFMNVMPIISPAKYDNFWIPFAGFIRFQLNVWLSVEYLYFRYRVARISHPLHYY